MNSTLGRECGDNINNMVDVLEMCVLGRFKGYTTVYIERGNFYIFRRIKKAFHKESSEERLISYIFPCLIFTLCRVLVQKIKRVLFLYIQNVKKMEGLPGLETLNFYSCFCFPFSSFIHHCVRMLHS